MVVVAAAFDHRTAHDRCGIGPGWNTLRGRRSVRLRSRSDASQGCARRIRGTLKREYTVAEDYLAPGPTRAEIDAMPGSVVVEFGTSWCGYCQAAQGPIANAFEDFPNVAHIKIEDGKGYPTGRSFGVELWPTLVFMSDGMEVARVVRPTEANIVSQALAELVATDQSDG
jgi:thioredoxin 1